MILNLIGTAYDWERFLVTYPNDVICHHTGIDAFTAFHLISTLGAFLVARLWRK